MTKSKRVKAKLLLGISIPSENPESILTKVGIAKRYQLNGIALWRLGLLTDEMWDALRKTVITQAAHGVIQTIEEEHHVEAWAGG